MTEAGDVPSSPGGADPRFSPGDKLDGRYRIVHLIGEGAIGEVYEAYDEALSEPVALKTLRVQVAAHAVQARDPAGPQGDPPKRLPHL